MARHFFSGGMMPSADLALHFQRDLVLDRRWWLPGTHYQRTAEAWLANLDARRDEVRAVLGAHAAHADGMEAERAVGRWRLFFLACAELFGHGGGSEWGVAHYRMARR
jgi:cyclopropane-fatty-acyl-phospholipid synthase